MTRPKKTTFATALIVMTLLTMPAASAEEGSGTGDENVWSPAIFFGPGLADIDTGGDSDPPSCVLTTCASAGAGITMGVDNWCNVGEAKFEGLNGITPRCGQGHGKGKVWDTLFVTGILSSSEPGVADACSGLFSCNLRGTGTWRVWTPGTCLTVQVEAHGTSTAVDLDDACYEVNL